MLFKLSHILPFIPSIYLLNKHLESAFCMLGTLLNAGDIRAREKETWAEEADSKKEENRCVKVQMYNVF